MSKYRRKSVLFICIGNACRSPMAEAIARVDASDVIDAFSAGLAPTGFVTDLTNQTLMRNGYWVEGLESKSVSPRVWEQVDIVINMSRLPRELVFHDYLKVEDWEIEDPMGQDPEIYQKVFEKIRMRVAELAKECRGGNGEARIVERRARARLCPTSLVAINLNGANGGIAFNISENGLALSAAMILPDGPFLNLCIQFSGSQHWIQASGEIAWRSKSNKEAGVRFVGLTEEACQEIGSWIASEASPERWHAETRAPIVGPKGEPRPSTSSWIFFETSRSASPLEAGTLHEERHPLSAGTNDKPKSSKPEYVSLGAATDERIQNARISTDPAASREETEKVVAKPAPLEAQGRIEDWIPPQALPGDVQEQVERISEKQDLRPEIPNPREPRNWIHASSANGEAGKAVFCSAVAPESKNIDQMDSAPRTSEPTRKRSDKKALRFKSRLSHAQTKTGVQRRAWGAFSALMSLIGLISLSLGWVARQRNVRSEGVADAAQKTEILSESAKSANPPSVSRIARATSRSAEKRDPQPQAVEPPVAAKAQNVRDSRLKSEDQHVRAEARASAKRNLKTTNLEAQSRPVERTFAPGRATRRSLGLAAGVNSRPNEKARPQTVSGLPPPPQLETNIARPAILVPLPSSNVRPPPPESIASSVPAAKQPATPANITGAVAIIADPYPSLRIPNGGSKKQRQGTSLQLGHLLSRVEPVYPEDAKQQGVQGTVKLHAVIDRHGSVKTLQSVNGPPLLVAAAMNAVRQWRFSETLLASQTVETEEDIDVIFRLSNPGASRK